MLERDKLAKELPQKYPEIVTQLVELLTRVDGCNREIAAINNKLPDGGSRVLEARTRRTKFEGLPAWVNCREHHRSDAIARVGKQPASPV